jgi:hypothetical protein
MNLRVVKHEADEEKDQFKIVLKGEASELVNGCIIEAELRLKGKVDELLEKFPRNHKFTVSINSQVVKP